MVHKSCLEYPGANSVYQCRKGPRNFYEASQEILEYKTDHHWWFSNFSVQQNHLERLKNTLTYWSVQDRDQVRLRSLVNFPSAHNWSSNRLKARAGNSTWVSNMVDPSKGAHYQEAETGIVTLTLTQAPQIWMSVFLTSTFKIHKGGALLQPFWPNWSGEYPRNLHSYKFRWCWSC